MAGRVVVIGLGPAGPELVTAQTLELIRTHPVRFIRTVRHPSASLVTEADAHGATSFDAVYDTAADLESVYEAIAARLATAAAEHGEVLYAVPGSPAVAEHTVELLRSRGDIDLEVAPAMSFADLAWSRLGVDPLADGVAIVDGHRFGVHAAAQAGPLLVAQCDRREVLSDIKLAFDDPPDTTVTVLHRLGLPDERIFEVRWDDLDRSFDPDHLTSLYIPKLAAPVAGEVARFVELVTTLRNECPWDAKQTHGSLRPHLLEETYEVLEALDAVAALGDVDAGVDGGVAPSDVAGEDLDAAYELLAEELGDLLFQVVFHAVLGTEAGRFTMADVATGVHDKLRSRHPHVFADVVVAGADDVESNWETIKAAEKGRASVLDGIPPGLPALAAAQKLHKRAAGAGLLDAVDTTTPADRSNSADKAMTGADISSAADLGETLYLLAARAREMGIDAEQALREAVAGRETQARAVESAQNAGSSRKPGTAQPSE
jgi:tetrapyrrole methylase family protein/MazG family protein